MIGKRSRVGIIIQSFEAAEIWSPNSIRGQTGLRAARSHRRSRATFAQVSKIVMKTDGSNALKGWKWKPFVVTQNSQILKRNHPRWLGEFSCLGEAPLLKLAVTCCTTEASQFISFHKNELLLSPEVFHLSFNCRLADTLATVKCHAWPILANFSLCCNSTLNRSPLVHGMFA